ncbi:hypothetical protein BST61_g7195 [Cercospora zeina]
MFSVRCPSGLYLLQTGSMQEHGLQSRLNLPPFSPVARAMSISHCVAMRKAMPVSPLDSGFLIRATNCSAMVVQCTGGEHCGLNLTYNAFGRCSSAVARKINCWADATATQHAWILRSVMMLRDIAIRTFTDVPNLYLPSASSRSSQLVEQPSPTMDARILWQAQQRYCKS